MPQTVDNPFGGNSLASVDQQIFKEHPDFMLASNTDWFLFPGPEHPKSAQAKDSEHLFSSLTGRLIRIFDDVAPLPTTQFMTRKTEYSSKEQ